MKYNVNYNTTSNCPCIQKKKSQKNVKNKEDTEGDNIGGILDDSNNISTIIVDKFDDWLFNEERIKNVLLTNYDSTSEWLPAHTTEYGEGRGRCGPDGFGTVTTDNVMKWIVPDEFTPDFIKKYNIEKAYKPHDFWWIGAAVPSQLIYGTKQCPSRCGANNNVPNVNCALGKINNVNAPKGTSCGCFQYLGVQLDQNNDKLYPYIVLAKTNDGMGYDFTQTAKNKILNFPYYNTSTYYFNNTDLKGADDNNKNTPQNSFFIIGLDNCGGGCWTHRGKSTPLTDINMCKDEINNKIDLKQSDIFAKNPNCQSQKAVNSGGKCLYESINTGDIWAECLTLSIADSVCCISDSQDFSCGGSGANIIGFWNANFGGDSSCKGIIKGIQITSNSLVINYGCQNKKEENLFENISEWIYDSIGSYLTDDDKCQLEGNILKLDPTKTFISIVPLECISTKYNENFFASTEFYFGTKAQCPGKNSGLSMLEGTIKYIKDKNLLGIMLWGGSFLLAKDTTKFMSGNITYDLQNLNGWSGGSIGLPITDIFKCIKYKGWKMNDKINSNKQQYCGLWYTGGTEQLHDPSGIIAQGGEDFMKCYYAFLKNNNNTDSVYNVTSIAFINPESIWGNGKYTFNFKGDYTDKDINQYKDLDKIWNKLKDLSPYVYIPAGGQVCENIINTHDPSVWQPSLCPNTKSDQTTDCAKTSKQCFSANYLGQITYCNPYCGDGNYCAVTSSSYGLCKKKTSKTTACPENICNNLPSKCKPNACYYNSGPSKGACIQVDPSNPFCPADACICLSSSGKGDQPTGCDAYNAADNLLTFEGIARAVQFIRNTNDSGTIMLSIGGYTWSEWSTPSWPPYKGPIHKVSDYCKGPYDSSDPKFYWERVYCDPIIMGKMTGVMSYMFKCGIEIDYEAINGQNMDSAQGPIIRDAIWGNGGSVSYESSKMSEFIKAYRFTINILDPTNYKKYPVSIDLGSSPTYMTAAHNWASYSTSKNQVDWINLMVGNLPDEYVPLVSYSGASTAKGSSDNKPNTFARNVFSIANTLPPPTYALAYDSVKENNGIIALTDGTSTVYEKVSTSSVNPNWCDSSIMHFDLGIGPYRFNLDSKSSLKNNLAVPVTGGDPSSSQPKYSGTGNMIKYKFVDYKTAFSNSENYFEPVALEQGVSTGNLSALGCTIIANKPPQ
jgi:hypothetical protein